MVPIASRVRGRVGPWGSLRQGGTDVKCERGVARVAGGQARRLARRGRDRGVRKGPPAVDPRAGWRWPRAAGGAVRARRVAQGREAQGTQRALQGLMGGT